MEELVRRTGDFVTELGRFPVSQWFIWKVAMPLGTLIVLFQAFRWVISPMLLLGWALFGTGDPRPPLRPLYWTTVLAPFFIVKILYFPTSASVPLILPVGIVTLSYRRIMRCGAVAIHPLELRFWKSWGSKVDAQIQYRLGVELEESQRRRRERKYHNFPEPPAPGVMEIVRWKVLTGGIKSRRESAERTELDEYYEVKGDDGVFPSQAAMECYYRAGWPISLWLLREFEANYRFCAPVRWHRNKMTGEIECMNGHNFRARENLMANHEDLVIGSVSVLEPGAVEPALALVDLAVRKLKFHSTNYMKGRQLRSRRRYRGAVAIHCEYTQFPPEFRRSSFERLDVDVGEWQDEMVQNMTTGQMESAFVEKDRELINLLTITVDRYFVATFHIAQMLERPTAETSQVLTRIFNFLMNPLKPKIWLDLARGIAALDATMEHVYRGPKTTGADVYHRRPYRESPDSPLRYPSFKDTGPADNFYVDRPPQLMFPRGSRPCPLGFHGDGVDFADRSCPCFSGNLDFKDILDLILRTYCFVPHPNVPRSMWTPCEGSERTSTGLGVHHCWAEPRAECRYEDFLVWMLAGDKFQPMLLQLRTRGKKRPTAPEMGGLSDVEAGEAARVYKARLAEYRQEEDAFLEFLKETAGFERNDEQLSYVVGAGIGIALAFRELLTCETPRIIAERLSNYGYREQMDVEPWAFETALFRPPPEEFLEYGKVFDMYELGLSFNPPFDPLATDHGSALFHNLAASPEEFVRWGTHDMLQGTLAQDINRRYQSTGMRCPTKHHDKETELIAPRPRSAPDMIHGDTPVPARGRVWQSATRKDAAGEGEVPLIGSRGRGRDITARSVAAEVFRNNHALLLRGGNAVEMSNPIMLTQLILLLCLHSDDDDPVLAAAFQGMLYELSNERWFLESGKQQRIATQVMWNWQQTFTYLARPPTLLLQQRTCAETLILMLMCEISEFASIDACRREGYNFDTTRQKYAAHTTRPLFDEPAVVALNKQHGLTGEFEYKEPYWFKRLQVLVGPALARGIALGETAIATRCGFQGFYQVLHKLVNEVERFGKLDAFHSELQPLLAGICDAAGLPTDHERPADPALRTTPPSGPTWKMPEWCTYLLHDLTPRPQVTPPPCVQPYSTRNHDQLQAMSVLLRRNPSLEPTKWSHFSKWWTHKLRVQALCLADEHVEKFQLPDLEIIWPRDPGEEYYPPPVLELPLGDVNRERHRMAAVRRTALYQSEVGRALAGDRDKGVEQGGASPVPSLQGAELPSLSRSQSTSPSSSQSRSRSQSPSESSSQSPLSLTLSYESLGEACSDFGL